MSDSRCPICKTDSYLNPEMVLYISPCFHKICESCMIRNFNVGKNKCYECGIELRKINYITSTFEDIEVEKECKIRRQFNKYFYRNEDDFNDIEEYNDYLEEYEKCIYELCEFKSESLIKQRINEILLSDSILNKKIVLVAEEINENSLEFDFKEDIEPIIKKCNENVYLPSKYYVKSECGGLSKSFIISYLLKY